MRDSNILSAQNPENSSTPLAGAAADKPALPSPADNDKRQDPDRIAGDGDGGGNHRPPGIEGTSPDAPATPVVAEGRGRHDPDASACNGQGHGGDFAAWGDVPGVEDQPDYVRRALDRLAAAGGEVRATSSGWLASCPCPTHGSDGRDSSPSLRITVGSAGKVLLKCQVGCQTEAVLAAVGLTWANLWPPPGQEPAEPIIPEEAGQPGYEDVAVRHEVYHKTLLTCVLAGSTLEALAKRGFSKDDVIHFLYQTSDDVTYSSAARKVVEALGADKVSKTPGFYKNDMGRWFLAAPPGILIPVRNVHGQIVALKVRRRDWVEGDKLAKYVLVSCPSRGGLSSGNPIHVPLHEGTVFPRVRVTEGEFKADYCTLKTDLLTISIPGVNSWRPSLQVLRELGAVEVLVALDWPDVHSKSNIRDQLRAFLHDLRMAGYKVGIETWPLEHKGIDDALLAGVKPQEVWGDDVSRLLGDDDQDEDSSEAEVPATPWPDPLHDDALYGLAGDVVRLLEPHTEADPVGLLLQFLVCFGSIVGRRPYFLVEGTRHYTNLFCTLVGRTGKSRKGTSFDRVVGLLQAVGGTGGPKTVSRAACRPARGSSTRCATRPATTPACPTSACSWWSRSSPALCVWRGGTATSCLTCYGRHGTRETCPR
jgi:hypothetical protein